MLENLTSKKWIIIGTAVIGLLLAYVNLLYFNQGYYESVQSKINWKTSHYLNIDLNKLASAFDIVGILQSLKSPLEAEDIIEMRIEEDQLALLHKYAQKSPPKKKRVDVQININGRYETARAKFHGTSVAHYVNNRFSYNVKLDSVYLNNGRKFQLIKQREAGPSILAVNTLAFHEGLIASPGRMVMLKINGEEHGVYALVEHYHSKAFLEREYGITNYAVLRNVVDKRRKEYFIDGYTYGSGDPHRSDLDLEFEHIQRKTTDDFPKAINQFRIFGDAIKRGDIEAVKDMIDMDYYAKFFALQSLFNDVHFTSGHNTKYIYDFTKNQFFMVYRTEKSHFRPDVSYAMGDKITFSFPNYNRILLDSYRPMKGAENHALYEVLLSDNEFRTKRDRYLYELISSKKGLTKMLDAEQNKHKHVMKYSKVPRPAFEFDKKIQASFLQRMMVMADQYLNYCLIYSSYDASNNVLHVISDAYVPIRVIHPSIPAEQGAIHGLEFDAELNYHTKEVQIDLNSDSAFKPKQLIFINEITGDTIPKKNVVINRIEYASDYATYSSLDMLQSNHIRHSVVGDSLIIKTGSYKIERDVIISPKYTTIIEKGVQLSLSRDVNFMVLGNLVIKGTATNKVTISNALQDHPFGTFSVIGKRDGAYTRIDHLEVSGGSSSFMKGYKFTGQFAIYRSNATIRNSSFSRSHGDDGLNIKNSKVSIDNCQFINNKADQIDLDFCFATVSNSTFSPSMIDPNGDGLDLSGCYASIKGCEFSNFLDKGLSLGENSKVLVSDNTFTGNKSAVSIKDQTQVYSWNNAFSENQGDYTLYVKKQIFGLPELHTRDNQEKLRIQNIEGKVHSIDGAVVEKEKNRFIESGHAYQVQNTLIGVNKNIPGNLPFEH